MAANMANVRVWILKLALFRELHALCSTIGNHTHDNFSPAFFAPNFRTRPGAQMRDILLDTVHGSSKQNLVFIIQCNDDKQLRLSRLLIQYLTQGKSFLFKVGRVTGRCRIPHMREFTIFLVREGIEEAGRDGTIEDEIALEEVDTFHGLESSRLARRRLTSSDIGTFVHVIIGIRSVGIVNNVGILIILGALLGVVVVAVDHLAGSRLQEGESSGVSTDAQYLLQTHHTVFLEAHYP